MAQLKDTVVSGSLRATDSLLSTTAQFKILQAPTSSGGTTYGTGTAGNILFSAGANGIYWGATTNITTLGTVTTGTWSATAIAANKGGTGQTAYAVGDMLYCASANTLSKLTIGGAGSYLKSTGSAPAWTHQYIYYGTCTDAAGTASKNVTCADYSGTLTEGDMILVKFSNTNSAATNTLKLKINNQSATEKPIKCQVAGSIIDLPAVGYLVANRTYLFAYDGANWMMLNVNRDNNDNDVNNVYSASGANRTAETAANGGIGLYRYSLHMMTANQTWSSIAHQANSTAADQGANSTKVAATASFLLNSPILYSTSNAYVAPGNGGNLDGYTAVALNFGYNTSGAPSFTIQRPVYLVGIPDKNSSTFKLPTSGWYTQTLPSTNDGKIYILLGIAYNATNIYLQTYHPAFWFDGSKIRLYTGEEGYGAVLPATGREGQIFYQISETAWELPAGGTAGQALIKNSATDRDVKWGSVGGIMRPNTTTKYYVTGSSSTTENTNPAIFNTSIFVEGGVLFGAAWNDYAEKRRCDALKPGTCVIENDNGILTQANKRLVPGACIISDTYGMCIGETEHAKTPVAITGRVLAYTFQPRDKYHAGMAVCSAPNGTIDIMTREEIRDYPDAIIGIVSEIPLYEYWGEGHVKVNNRIWIKVK